MAIVLCGVERVNMINYWTLVLKQSLFDGIKVVIKFIKSL